MVPSAVAAEAPRNQEARGIENSRFRILPGWNLRKPARAAHTASAKAVTGELLREE